MSLKILKAPNHILRTVCDPVTKFEPELKIVAKEMFDAMHACKEPKGIGLAANQVGFAIRLIVTHIRAPKAMCNPFIEWRKGEVMSDELCLSEPGIRVSVKRAREIKVRYQDLDGNQKSLVARDLLARCIQHEIDHLNGILLSDHLPKEKP
jgi:peptide deformylase